MGHIIGYLSEKENCNRAMVMLKIQEIAEQDGDGYPGRMTWHDRVEPLKNHDAAEEFIKAHDKGWYDDHAVRYFDYSRAKETKKISEYRAKIEETRAKQGEYAREHSVMKQKAAFIGCGKCGSKIAKEYLRSEYCPVCRTDMRSKTTIETLDRYQKKIDGLWKKIEEEKEKQTGEVRWLIKYEYHC